MRSTPPELARIALDAAPDAMLIIDSSGTIRYASRQASTLFRRDRDAIVGQSIEILIPERFGARHVAHRDGYFHDPRPRPMGAGLQLYARRGDGTEFPVEISLSPIDDTGSRLVAAAIRDITDRKRAETELIAAREEAEHAREVADHARQSADHARQSADSARQLADRANQSKSRFLATASHDLRQPLQTLALLNGTLRRLVTDSDASSALEQQEMAIPAGIAVSRARSGCI